MTSPSTAAATPSREKRPSLPKLLLLGVLGALACGLCWVGPAIAAIGGVLGASLFGWLPVLAAGVGVVAAIAAAFGFRRWRRVKAAGASCALPDASAPA